MAFVQILVENGRRVIVSDPSLFGQFFVVRITVAHPRTDRTVLRFCVQDGNPDGVKNAL